MKKSVWLHNIRSVYNVGSIFRTADALGVKHIYLSGYTPQPIDRFGRHRSNFAKIALGAEKSVSWSVLENPFEEIKKKEAFLVVLEQDEQSIPLDEFTRQDATEIILAVGEEVNGMKQEQLALADTIIEIPMHGEKESLNVSVAFGIAGYTIFKG
jgi:tRNA G18 (ribose-2'-O)-methylase SpoU